MRTADNLRDYLRLLEVVSAYSTVDRDKFLDYVRTRLNEQLNWFRKINNVEAVEAHLEFRREMDESGTDGSHSGRESMVALS